jgi:hypothetical protein
MPVTISEQPSIEHLKSTWAQIVLALEPLTDTLPEPYKSFFNSPVKLLIGNKISLAIIPPKHLWSYIEDVEEIYTYLYNIDYLGYDLDFVLLRISAFLSRLGLTMSVDGKFLLEGPMSQQKAYQRQELIGINELQEGDRK